MTTKNEIYRILKNKDKETLYIEFKKSMILKNPNGKKKLAGEIVAFANRYGGKILIGINNDGSFEGKGIFDDKNKSVDHYKNDIDNLCHNNISPIVECTMEFMQFSEGDVLVVNIPKRKDIPHAYIFSKKGIEVENRIYRIRTSHGTRLTSDRQLQWMFTHLKDPCFEYKFRLIINYFDDSLQIPYFIGQPRCSLNYLPFVQDLPVDDIKIFKKNMDKAHAFFLEITPYALINSLVLYFKHSWLIKIGRHDNTIESGIKTRQLNSKEIYAKDLPEPPLVSSLSLDFQKIIDKYFLPSFYVPLDTELKFEHVNGKFSKLSLLHKKNDFNFNITFNYSGMVRGMDFPDLDESYMRNENKNTKSEELWQSIFINGIFTGSFNFPDEDLKQFYDYKYYSDTIKDILENEWNWDRYIEKIPIYRTYVIDHKLDKILKKLNNI